MRGRKKKKNHSSEIPSISERESTRKRRVKGDPGLSQLQDALEHIIVTGAKVRRDDWRRHQFDQKEKNRPNPAEPGCPPKTATSDEGKEMRSRMRGYANKRRKRERLDGTIVCHAEDLRIYGKQHNLHLLTFASETQKIERQQNNHLQGDDLEWNFEHGDSVPPILFRMARLSGEYPSLEQLSRFNHPNAKLSKSFTSTDITLPKHDIPRALIEKCWERAVHIASNALVVPVDKNSKTIGEVSNARGSSSSVPFGNGIPLSRESCREKCKSLGIDIESIRKECHPSETISDTTCPRCTRSFSTTDSLLNHYYGTDGTFGCCGALIRPRHLDLIRSLLQNYLESQIDQLGAISVAHHRVHGQTASKKGKEKQPKQILNWKDVHRCMEHAVENSTPIPTEDASNHLDTDTRHPVQQSMNVTSGASVEEENEISFSPAPPLMLNSMVVDAVHRRLIDRYADLPP